MKPFDSRELEALLPRLWDLGEADWVGYRVAKDPLRGKITPADAERLARAAAARAALALRRFGGDVSAGAVERWAAGLGVEVREDPVCPGDAPPFLSLAERRPARIRLSGGALAQIGRTVGAYGLADRAGDAGLWRRLLIAHELYHHLEWNEPETFRPGEEVVLWRLCGFSRRAVPVCASEMGAMSFAYFASGKALQPDVVELLFLAGHSPGVALEWVRLALGERAGEPVAAGVGGDVNG